MGAARNQVRELPAHEPAQPQGRESRREALAKRRQGREVAGEGPSTEAYEIASCPYCGNRIKVSMPLSRRCVGS